MATLEDDFARLHLEAAGTVNIQLKNMGLEWPPPERIIIGEDGKVREATYEDDLTYVMIRTNMSELTDEVASHPNLARGAEYRYWTSLAEEGQST